MASRAPFFMNSPYPPSGPERMVWQPTLMGFFSLRSGVAPKPRGAASAASPAAPVLRKVRRVVRRDAAMSMPPSYCCHCVPTQEHSAALSAATEKLLGGDGPDARLDLLAAVPDGNELAGVADVVERVGLEDEEVGLLPRLERAPVLEAQHRRAS